jgi:hypothetical protein
MDRAGGRFCLLRLFSFSLMTGLLLAAPRFAQAADPTTADCLSATESSLALRNQHKLREARAALLICSAPSCPGDVRAECIRRVSEVNAAIPTIVFEAKDGAGNDLSAVRVTIDGQPLVERLEGTALSIDPGVHAFTFETTGQTPLSKQLVIREGEKERRERVVFGAGGGVVAVAPAGTAPPDNAGGSTTDNANVVSSSASPGAPAGGGWSTQKKVGVGLASAGAAGLVTGVIFSFVYNSKASDFNNAGCSTSLPNDGPAGCSSKHDSAKTAQTLFITGYASALVLGGVGAYLFFTAPADAATSKIAFQKGSFSVRCLPSAGAAVTCGGTF